MRYCADITGAEIMRTLRDEARNPSPDIRVIEFTAAAELVLNEYGHCVRAVTYNMETEEYSLIKARGWLWLPGGRPAAHSGLPDHQSLWSHRRWHSPGL